MSTQVKLARDEDLVSFTHNILRKHTKFSSQLSAEQADRETSQGAMAPPKKGVFREDIVEREAQLVVTNAETDARRRAPEKELTSSSDMSSAGRRHYGSRR